VSIVGYPPHIRDYPVNLLLLLEAIIVGVIGGRFIISFLQNLKQKGLFSGLNAWWLIIFLTIGGVLSFALLIGYLNRMYFLYVQYYIFLAPILILILSAGVCGVKVALTRRIMWSGVFLICFLGNSLYLIRGDLYLRRDTRQAVKIIKNWMPTFPVVVCDSVFSGIPLGYSLGKKCGFYLRVPDTEIGQLFGLRLPYPAQEMFSLYKQKEEEVDRAFFSTYQKFIFVGDINFRIHLSPLSLKEQKQRILCNFSKFLNSINLKYNTAFEIGETAYCRGYFLIFVKSTEFIKEW
jgi:hypothetical protein